MALNVQAVVQETPQTERVIRRPKHTFLMRRQRPYQISPFMIAPVLANETLQSLQFQSRAVTDPLTAKLIGHHLEHYFFYVKLRDLDIREHMEGLLLDPEFDKTPIKNDTPFELHYYLNGAVGAQVNPTINWVRYCLQRVTECYFRDEDEEWTNYRLDGIPLAQAEVPGWSDSIVREAVANINAGGTADIDLTDPGSAAGAAVTTSEIETAMRQWMTLKNNAVVNMGFDEYLASFGVQMTMPDTEHHIPELIRYSRDWSYPTNTVEPTTGVPTTAVSWTVQERADKARYFAEPGFIFGVTVWRPKTYWAAQKSYGATLMRDQLAWLPATMWNDTNASLQLVAAGDSPLSPTNSAENWVDVRDLLVHGDQWLDLDSAGTNDGNFQYNTDDSPAEAIDARRYPSEASIDSWFVDPVNKKYVVQDGICQLRILSHQRDTTPRSLGNPGNL